MLHLSRYNVCQRFIPNQIYRHHFTANLTFKLATNRAKGCIFIDLLLAFIWNVFAFAFGDSRILVSWWSPRFECVSCRNFNRTTTICGHLQTTPVTSGWHCRLNSIIKRFRFKLEARVEGFGHRNCQFAKSIWVWFNQLTCIFVLDLPESGEQREPRRARRYGQTWRGRFGLSRRYGWWHVRRHGRIWWRFRRWWATFMSTFI